ncbi:MAG: hypothetical protein ACYTGE_12565, partial [Planctomycetota bacterium]
MRESCTSSHPDQLAHLGPAEAPLGEGPVDLGQLHEGLAGGEKVAGLAAAHAEAQGGPLGRGAAAVEPVQPAGVDVLEVEGDDAVLEPGGGVGETDPL